METPELKERGYFWWSDDKLDDDHFASPSGCSGVLTITQEGVIDLDLDGVLPNEKGRWAALERKPLTRTISGIIRETQRHVILSGLIRNGSSVSTNSPSYERFSASNCIVSSYRLARDGSTPMFRRLTIALTGYEEWTGRGDIEIQEREDSIILTHNQNNNQIYRLPDKLVRLRFFVDGPKSGKWFREASFKEAMMIDMKFYQPINIERIIKEHNSFQELLVILVNSERSLTWPILHEFSGNGKSVLYFRRSKREDTDIRHLECWVSLPKILPDLGKVMALWTEKSHKIGPGIYMYSGNRRGMKLYVENRFTNLIFGLESMHRATAPYMPNPNLEAKITRIMERVELEKDKKWLKEQLKYTLEPTLSRRLVELFELLPVDLTKERLTEFADRCARLRNDISHFGGTRRPEEQTDFVTEISKVNGALDVLYHLRILKEIGVPDTIIRNLVYSDHASYNVRWHLFENGLLADDPSSLSAQLAQSGPPPLKPPPPSAPPTAAPPPP